MNITYKHSLTRLNEDDQTIYFTVTDDEENSYEWHGDIPIGVDIQEHLEKNIEKIYDDLMTHIKVLEITEWKSTHPVQSESDKLNEKITELENRLTTLESKDKE